VIHQRQHGQQANGHAHEAADPNSQPEGADLLAQHDCRPNAVHGWSIRFARPQIAEALAAALADPQAS